MTSDCRLRVLAAAPILWLLLAAGEATAAAPGRLGGGEDLSISLWRVLAAILVCTMIALLAALVVRARGGGAKIGLLVRRLPLRPRTIGVVETRRLSPHADISVVQHRGQEYLLLLQAGHAQVLNVETVPEAAAEEVGSAP